ncbi:MAG TPA: FmdB family zinc ribbon protein [Acidimicrobiales bacterium]|jgi:putative FmdB family regulatory protein|nr:FmdB family zinc ribbon protein [Acidimicrobiales bacterium]
MPIYEYACRSCGQHLEIAQSFKDDALTTCPACGGPLRKVYGSIGITFKGSGFYRTDSRGASTNGAKVDTAEKAGAEKTGTDKAAKSDASTKGEGSSGGGDAKGTAPSKASKGPNAPKPKAASA